MGGNVGEQTILCTNDAAESSQTTIEIKIKTLDSQTFTMQVDKHVPVPELKEQIASVTGIQSSQQRLICRGRVLKDDQHLSAYHVEDGHTLHLVVTQQEYSSHLQDTDTISSTGYNSDDEESPDIVIRTFNAADAFPDFIRLVSALLGSSASGSEGPHLNQFLEEQPSIVIDLNGPTNSSRLQPEESLQSPDLLTTLSLYLRNLRGEFIVNAVGDDASPRNEAFYGSVIQDLEDSESGGVLTPEYLASVVSYTRRLLFNEASECLSVLEGQLIHQACVTDPMERSRMQSDAIRSGGLIQSLGSSLLDLGRAITSLQLGETPAEAVVNAGEPVFVSSTGPNPITVHPSGSIPVEPDSGLAGSYYGEPSGEAEGDPSGWQDEYENLGNSGSLVEELLRSVYPIDLNIPPPADDQLQMEVDEKPEEEDAKRPRSE